LPNDEGRLADQQSATPAQVERTDLATQIASAPLGSVPAIDPIPEPTQPSTETARPPESSEVVATEPAVTPAPTRPEPAAVTTPAAQSEPTDPAIVLVKNAGPREQFVQHIVLASRARAQAWIETQTGASRAIVVPVNVNGATRYAVVSGPFQNRAESRTYIQGLGQGADYWVRTAGSLQRILQDGE
jgi:hypothetical protein